MSSAPQILVIMILSIELSRVSDSRCGIKGVQIGSAYSQYLMSTFLPL